jgi:hypothetical protein
MPEFSVLEWVYVLTAFLFQFLLLIHFALRKWRFNTAIRYGWIVYGLSVPAAGVSVWLMVNSMPWWSWLGGWLYLVWSIFGYIVEYIRKIEWRDPIFWPVFGPYITLYLATVMFYWWPLARIWKPLWFMAAILFAINTLLNITSHKRN